MHTKQRMDLFSLQWVTGSWVKIGHVECRLKGVRKKSEEMFFMYLCIYAIWCMFAVVQDGQGHTFHMYYSRQNTNGLLCWFPFISNHDSWLLKDQGSGLSLKNSKLSLNMVHWNTENHTGSQFLPNTIVYLKLLWKIFADAEKHNCRVFENNRSLQNNDQRD